MKGLLTKIFLEVRWPSLLFAGGFAAITSILTAVLPKVLGNFPGVLERLPFVKPFITALLGIDPGSDFSTSLIQALLWVHPSIFAVLWAHEVMYCTRVPAGEIDRGTIDFLLGLSVSRWKVYAAETIGWLVSGLAILACGVSGHVFTAWQVEEGIQPTLTTTVVILCNLLSVYIAVGSIALLVSCLSDHRNRAIGMVFAILLFSFLLDFLAQFWSPAQHIAWLSILEYYRPAVVIQSGRFPTGDVITLLSIGVVAWSAGGLIFQRRSICTV